MIKVGIVGEMGSGKSRCCGLFASLGTPVFLADIHARSIMNNNDEVKYMLKKLVNPLIYNEDDIIDKDVMQHFLFEHINSKTYRASVEIVISMYLNEKYNKFIEKYKDEKYTIFESAILFESNWFEKVDYIIYVDCPKSERVRRVIERSRLSEEQQDSRTNHLFNPKLKMRASDSIILNDGVADIIEQVDAMHKYLISVDISDLIG